MNMFAWLQSPSSHSSMIPVFHETDAGCYYMLEDIILHFLCIKHLTVELKSNQIHFSFDETQDFATQSCDVS